MADDVLEVRGFDATHRQAAGRFNRGEYLAAAQAWTTAWHDLGADEGPGGPEDPGPPLPEAILFRGLVRVSAGMARYAEDRPGPAARLLEMGLADLEGLGPVATGIDVAALIASGRTFLSRLRQTPAVEPVLLPRIQVRQ
jgi:hypothetical protein